MSDIWVGANLNQPAHYHDWRLLLSHAYNYLAVQYILIMTQEFSQAQLTQADKLFEMLLYYCKLHKSRRT